jgi:palmitoyltransferase
VNNCVANNNHRHFVFYVLCLEIGILFWVRLVLACKLRHSKLTFSRLTVLDLEVQDTPKDVQCSIISDDLCKILNKDPYTIVLSIWAAFQLTWVTMLLCVQLLQVARNLTTYESMRGHLHSHTTPDAINSFVTTGDTSQDVTGGNSATNGFGSGQDTSDAPRPHQPKPSILDQWKRLLGLDTFVATALQGSQAGQRRRQGNPWSRGIITNCKDFFCDGSPVFGKKEGGYARLAGERVDYTRLYDVPKMRYARGGAADGARYESVAEEEEAA